MYCVLRDIVEDVSRLLSHDKRVLVMLVTGDILGCPVIQARSGRETIRHSHQ